MGVLVHQSRTISGLHRFRYTAIGESGGSVMDGKRGDKNKRGRSNRGLRKLAEEHGYEPGEWSVKMQASLSELMHSWFDHMKRGEIPNELSHMKFSEARAFMIREMSDHFKREMDLLPFFHPKLSSVEGSVEHEGEVGLYQLMKARAGPNEQAPESEESGDE